MAVRGITSFILRPLSILLKQRQVRTQIRSSNSNSKSTRSQKNPSCSYFQRSLWYARTLPTTIPALSLGPSPLSSLHGYNEAKDVFGKHDTKKRHVYKKCRPGGICSVSH